MYRFIVAGSLAITSILSMSGVAHGQLSIGVGVGRPGGVYVNTPYFSFQYGRSYPGYYGHQPYAYYAMPYYGFYPTYPPVITGRGPVDYGYRNAPAFPNDRYNMFPREQAAARPIDAQDQKQAATVRVLVPVAEATVWFDSTRMKQTGLDRQYVTPPLQNDRVAAYRIRASWIEHGRLITREKTVTLGPGQEAVVDFNEQPIP